MTAHKSPYSFYFQPNDKLAKSFASIDPVHDLPVCVDIHDDQLTISSLNKEKSTDNSVIELVVFDTLTVEQFTAVLQQTKVSINALIAVNTRLNRTSYRFSVNVTDIQRAREALIQCALTFDTEMALIDNAPLLSAPGLLVMDMDSTTIKIECIDEIATLAGVGEQVAEVTERAMQGKLDFADSLRHRVATLKGASDNILETVAKDIPLMEGLATLIHTLKQHDWRVAIASGGFTYFAEHLQQLLPFDNVFANQLEIVDHQLTGRVLGDIVDATVKAQCVKKLSTQYNIPASQTVAMGDGANDLVMMDASQLGVAFHAKPIVLAKAQSCILSSGLDTLIHWLK